MAEAENIKKFVPPLVLKVEKMRKEAKERLQKKGIVEIEEVQMNPQVKPASAAVVHLVIWPETVRGVPNSILRSALFGAIKRGKRTFMQRVPVASYDNVTILQTGPRLDQADLDVWEQCMHIARTGKLGTRILFSAHRFLKSIERSTGKSQHEWLKGAFARLSASVVEIKDGRRVYFGPMIHHGTRDDETGQYCIEINPAIASLYGTDGWTQIEWEQRLALKRQPLAQWLHGFYSTHAAPYPLKVETIHRLCGSEAKLLKHFREELRGALTLMQVATNWIWEIDDKDLLHVKKTPKASQNRHIKRLKNCGTA